jgi:hypothetical protein
MAKPQQPELRRSGTVEALDPDATAARRTADRRRPVTEPKAPIPEDQRPGHHPDQDQDKPDMAKFAARLGVVKEGEEPEEAAHVEPDEIESRDVHVDNGRIHVVNGDRGERSGLPTVKFLFLGPAIGYVVARRIVRTLTGQR